MYGATNGKLFFDLRFHVLRMLTPVDRGRNGRQLIMECTGEIAEYYSVAKSLFVKQCVSFRSGFAPG